MNNSIDFVLDCSVTMPWCFEDETTEYTESVLNSFNIKKAIVPAIWPLEVTNVLLMTLKHKRITKIQAINFYNQLEQLPITISKNKKLNNFIGIFELGEELKLTSYDAVYLELALAHNIPIATLDKQLIEAAKKSGIKIY